ncbi:MAG: acyltransferase [Saprospiraceae bacterium]|nr:acyltransferase [Saprospiraceae bacterium]MCO5284477.1 acyltransferase [Saprospiraceae bacterium]HCA42006.1 acetyltransferase [Bacteroidota bacterium]
MSIIEKIKIGFVSIWHAILMILPNEFSKFRVRFYNKHGCIIHKKTSISPNVRIKGKFEMGEGSSIAQNCTISGEKAGIFIGENVMIAPNVVIVAFNHGIESLEIPMSKQDNAEAPIIIENNVWIGANCTIGCGVKIGTGSIIAANSFVNKDISPYSIVGGVPAKFIKTRIHQVP